MPDTKSSLFPDAGPLTGGEYVTLIQAGLNVKTPCSNLLSRANTNVFLSLYPGVDKTGTLDSAGALQAAINAVAGTINTLVVDCLCFIQVGTDRTKTVFIPSNVNIDFTSSGAFITDSLGLPCLALSGTVTNVTLQDFTIRYIGNPGANMLQYTGAWAVANAAWNNTTLTQYLHANNGNTFTGGATAQWPGPTNTSALIYISGNVTNVNFVGNCSATAVFATADRFIPCLFSLNTDWLPGNIPSGLPINASTTAQPSNISFDGFTVDGVNMAWVGTGANLKLRNITRFRYSDLEDSAGNNQGGIGTVSGRPGNLATDLWAAPPHLFYLQSGNPSFPCSYDYLNILDEGIYTTNNPNYGSRRTGLSGYINMMKIDASALNTAKNIVCKAPDGFCDVLSQGGGAISPGCTIENVDSFLDCGVGGTWMTVSSLTATSFSVAPANWVCNQSGASYTGVTSGTYMTTFSTGELRAVAYVVTVVGNSATAITASWTQPLLNSNTTLVRAGLTNAGRFTFRYPGAAAQNLFLKNIKVIDSALLPYCWPLLSDAATSHINVVADFSVIVQDYPTIAQYVPGFGLAGEGINCKVKNIFSNCSATQTLRGPIVNNTSAPTNDQFREDEIHGWRQTAITFAAAPTGTSANLLSACWQTGVVGWIYPSGTYNVLFSDNEVRAVAFTQGSVACTWTGALVGTPTVNAQACLINSAQFDQFKPRMQLAQTPPYINFGVRARIIDVSNGIEIEINQGLMEERWTQFWQGTPTGATPITYPATFAIDRAAWGVTAALSGGTATAINLTTGGNTILANGAISSPGPLPIVGPQPYAGVITVAPVSGSLPSAGTAVIMTRGVRTNLGTN